MMPEFGRRIDGPGGRRKDARNPVVLAASAVTLEGSRSVILEELCSTGAKLRGSGVARTGQQLMVRIGSLELLAAVIWDRRDQCGIAFDTPLGIDAIQVVKNEGRLATVMGIE